MVSQEHQQKIEQALQEHFQDLPSEKFLTISLADYCAATNTHPNEYELQTIHQLISIYNTGEFGRAVYFIRQNKNIPLHNTLVELLQEKKIVLPHTTIYNRYSDWMIERDIAKHIPIPISPNTVVVAGRIANAAPQYCWYYGTAVTRKQGEKQ